VSGSTANLSVAEVVSTDAANQGQWDLLLSKSGQRLSANSITTANTASWTANSIISIKQGATTIRSNVVNVTALNVSTTANINTLAVGTLTASNFAIGDLSSLTVTGNTTLMNSCKIFSQKKSLPVPTAPEVSLVGDAVALLDISNTYGNSCTLKLDMMQTEGVNNSISKTYTVPVGWNSTNGEWMRVLPDKAENSVNDIGLEIKVTGNILQSTTGVASFRLVRTNIDSLTNLVNGNIQCNYAVHYQEDRRPVIFETNTTMFSSISNEFNTAQDVYNASYVTQKSTKTPGVPSGSVGIGTEFPDQSYILDVNGRMKSKSIVSFGNVYTSGMYRTDSGVSFSFIVLGVVLGEVPGVVMGVILVVFYTTCRRHCRCCMCSMKWLRLRTWL
jgi:hypothetical protein